MYRDPTKQMAGFKALLVAGFFRSSGLCLGGLISSERPRCIYGVGFRDIVGGFRHLDIRSLQEALEAKTRNSTPRLKGSLQGVDTRAYRGRGLRKALNPKP